MATRTAVEPNHALPRSLIASGPWLWSRVLFPGHGEIDARVSWPRLALLFLLPAILLYPALSFHLLEPDEGRYAEIPREMLQRGDVVVPYLQGQPYLDKPPLLYWLVMGSYRVFGVHGWAARIPPALAVHLTILCVYLIGRRSLGERSAFWGALFLAVAPGFATMGRLLILDGLLTCCTTIGILAGFEAVRGSCLRRGWWRLAALAIGFGILTKGPVALLLMAPPIWLHCRLNGPTCRIGWRAIAEFLCLVLAINLPWYVAIGLREPEFLRYFFWEHNVVRFVQPFDHIRPVWFYLPVLAVLLLPGTLLLPGLLHHLLTGNLTRLRQRTPELGFFLLAGGWCVLFFSLAGSKLPTYILPALPTLALAIGSFVAGGGRGRRWIAAGLVIVAAAGLSWLHYRGLPWYAKMRSPMRDAEVVNRYCADRAQTVVCFPRSCDSLAFYLQRDDLIIIRSKESRELILMLRDRSRTVVLFTHRHSLASVREPFANAGLVLTEEATFQRDKAIGQWFDVLSTETPWGLCDVAVVETKK